MWTVYPGLQLAAPGEVQQFACCRQHEQSVRRDQVDPAAHRMGDTVRVHRADLPSRQLTVQCTAAAWSGHTDHDRIRQRLHTAMSGVHGLVHLVATATGAERFTGGRPLGNELEVLLALRRVEQYCQEAIDVVLQLDKARTSAAAQAMS